MVIRPRIQLLSTGGTISGFGRTATETAYEYGQIDACDLVATVDGLNHIADVQAETLFEVGSENLGPVQWFKLANRIEELTASDEVDGVVVTHGTDTLEEAAFFLDLVCRPKKPVALTAAMRPATALSADGPANLYQAVLAISTLKLQGPEIFVVMNGQVIPGWQVIKTDSVALSSFCAYPGGAVGQIVDSNLLANGGPGSSPIAGQFHDVLRKGLELPNVDIISFRGGCGNRPILSWNGTDCKGLVIAGFGAGTMPDSLATKLAEISQSGCVVVVSSRLSRVIVLSDTMSPGESDEIIPSGFLNPQKSALLLCLALAVGLNGSDIAKLFSNFSSNL